jgi:hypothetical protein
MYDRDTVCRDFKVFVSQLGSCGSLQACASCACRAGPSGMWQLSDYEQTEYQILGFVSTLADDIENHDSDVVCTGNMVFSSFDCAKILLEIFRESDHDRVRDHDCGLPLSCVCNPVSASYAAGLASFWPLIFELLHKYQKATVNQDFRQKNTISTTVPDRAPSAGSPETWLLLIHYPATVTVL